MIDHNTYWLIEWELNGGDSGEFGGWIIQEIMVYYRDQNNNWQYVGLAGGTGHFYEAWNVSAKRKWTTVKGLIDENKDGWRTKVNNTADGLLGLIIAKGCNDAQKQQAKKLLNELAEQKKKNGTTDFARFDDRFGIEMQYWQKKVQEVKADAVITGMKVEAKALFVRKRYKEEKLEDLFRGSQGPEFYYNNGDTGAGPLIQSMVGSSQNQKQMDEFMRKHSHSAAIDHILEITWDPGQQPTQVNTKP